MRHFRLLFYKSRNIFFYNIFCNEVAPPKEAITFENEIHSLPDIRTVFICHCIKSTLQLHKFQFSLGKIRLLMMVGAVTVDSNIITRMPLMAFRSAENGF